MEGWVTKLSNKSTSTNASRCVNIWKLLSLCLCMEGYKCILTKRKAFEAAVRLMPTPPAFKDISMTCIIRTHNCKLHNHELFLISASLEYLEWYISVPQEGDNGNSILIWVQSHTAFFAIYSVVLAWPEAIEAYKDACVAAELFEHLFSLLLWESAIKTNKLELLSADQLQVTHS